MRFVIQQHIAKKDEHYDLMIETEDHDALLAWKISKPDMDLLVKGDRVKAEKLTDHRKEYLTYEGPISNDRGTVKIFDSGDCRTILKRDNKFGFELKGEKVEGYIFLNSIEKNMFSIRYIPGTPSYKLA